MEKDSRPRDSTSLTAVLTMSFRRPVGTTVAPASASPSAIALPMPEVAPITTATRFVRSNAVMDMSGTILSVRRDGGQHNAARNWWPRSGGRKIAHGSGHFWRGDGSPHPARVQATGAGDELRCL